MGLPDNEDNEDNLSNLSPNPSAASSTVSSAISSAVSTLKKRETSKKSKESESLPSCFNLAKEFYLSNNSLVYCHDSQTFYWYQPSTQL